MPGALEHAVQGFVDECHEKRAIIVVVFHLGRLLDETLVKEIRQACAQDFHAVSLEILFEAVVRGRVYRKQDLAQQHDNRFSRRISHRDTVECLDGLEKRPKRMPAAAWQSPAQLPHAFVVCAFSAARANLVGPGAAPKVLEGIEQCEAQQYFQLHTRIDPEARVQFAHLVAGRHDRNVLVARGIKRLASQHGVLAGTTILAVLVHAESDRGLIGSIRFQHAQELPDIDLCRETNVVVQV